MPKFEFSTLEKRYNEIPDEVRLAISSVEYAEKLQQIAKKHLLHIDKIEDLGEAVGLVMLGLLPPNKFTETIKNELSLDQKTAEQITSEVNEVIFLPIRQYLQTAEHLNTNSNPDFFEKKMSHLFTSTADLRAERAEVEDYTPPANIGGSEDKAPLSANIPVSPEKKRPEGLDPYRELPI